MTMHRKPLTELERSGLEAHYLPVGKPSMLSDAFRLGIAWALNGAIKELVTHELTAHGGSVSDAKWVINDLKEVNREGD